MSVTDGGSGAREGYDVDMFRFFFCPRRPGTTLLQLNMPVFIQ